MCIMFSICSIYAGVVVVRCRARGVLVVGCLSADGKLAEMDCAICSQLDHHHQALLDNVGNAMRYNAESSDPEDVAYPALME